MNPSLSIWGAAVLVALGSGVAVYGLTLACLKGIAGASLPSFPAIPRWKSPIHRFTRAQGILVLGSGLGLGLASFVDLGLGSLALVLFFLGWTGAQKVPGILARRLERKRAERIETLFPQAIGMSIQALKTGQTLPQVLSYLSQECPSPLREEFHQACSEMDLGAPAEEALAQMARKYAGLEGLQQFLESYRISRRTGANLTRLLEVLLEGLEEKARLRRRMEAMTAQARLSGLLMGSLPLLLGIVFFLMDPELMTPLFTSKEGWALLLAAAFLEGFGFLWIRHLLRSEL